MGFTEPASKRAAVGATAPGGRMRAIVLLLVAAVTMGQSPMPVPAGVPITVSRMFTAQAPNDQNRWATCVNFTNTSGRGIRAIQFQFTYYDAFDTAISTFRGDRVGEFAPGVLVEGPENVGIVGGGNVNQKSQNCWVVGQLVGSLEKVTAAVVKVRYADGEIWTASTEAAIYTETYMSSRGGDTFVQPPKFIKCGMLKMLYTWYDRNRDNPKVVGCLKEWERDNGNIEGWPPAYVPKVSPSPLPSP